MMKKKLTRHGNSLALVIDRPVLDLLKIPHDATLNVFTKNGRTLTIAVAKAGKSKSKKSSKRRRSL